MLAEEFPYGRTIYNIAMGNLGYLGGQGTQERCYQLIELSGGDPCECLEERRLCREVK